MREHESHQHRPILSLAKENKTTQATPHTKPTHCSLPHPHNPTLRANPFPEVTDLICRLPLPTLFYGPETVHLGDLMRLSVRPDANIHTYVPRLFKGRRQGTGPDCPNRGSGFPSSPTLSPDKRIPGSQRSNSLHYRFQLLKRKENSSRACRRRRRVLVALVLPPCLQMRVLVQECEPVSLSEVRLGCILAREQPPFNTVRLLLRTDSPVSNCCSHGTLLHFGLQRSQLNSCYYHQDLH
jgi:hypothetical protein